MTDVLIGDGNDMREKRKLVDSGNTLSHFQNGTAAYVITMSKA
jgi:hypothetical protein